MAAKAEFSRCPKKATAFMANRQKSKSESANRYESHYYFHHYSLLLSPLLLLLLSLNLAESRCNSRATLERLLGSKSLISDFSLSSLKKWLAFSLSVFVFKRLFLALFLAFDSNDAVCPRSDVPDAHLADTLQKIISSSKISSRFSSRVY